VEPYLYLEAAQDYCIDLTTGDFTDWRLPSKDERNRSDFVMR
jgi:hypothetical protein